MTIHQKRAGEDGTAFITEYKSEACKTKKPFIRKLWVI